MTKQRWLTGALCAFALALTSGCNHTYDCVATCDGAPFSGYAGGSFSESSADDAVAACLVDLEAVGCTSPRVPACVCAD